MSKCKSCKIIYRGRKGEGCPNNKRHSKLRKRSVGQHILNIAQLEKKIDIILQSKENK